LGPGCGPVGLEHFSFFCPETFSFVFCFQFCVI
jgi:hypothetical protein